MPKAWLTIPSARVDAGTARVWKSAGYGIALFRDAGAPKVECADVVLSGLYEGYAKSVNRLVSIVMMADSDCTFAVAAGDDTTPDPVQTPDTIAMQLRAHFGGTFGVCQPTGDPWRDVQGRIIERIAGSAWYGRDYCRRINQGNGPLWPEYVHCFGDEEAQCVALKYGVFLQRPDLVQHHSNWARKDGATYADMPAFLKDANSAEHWAKYKGIFTERKKLGFPGSEPIA